MSRAMHPWLRGAVASTLLLAGTASAGDVFLIIWGGGTTRAQGGQSARELGSPPWSELLRPGEGYPRVEESRQVAGLKPGFHVATLGACATEQEARAFLKAVHEVAQARGGSSGVYTRAIQDGRSVACPRLTEGIPATPAAPEAEAAAAEVARLRTRCDAGDFENCLFLGDLLHPEGERRRNSKRPLPGPDEGKAMEALKKGVQLVEEGCARSEVKACLELSSLLDPTGKPWPATARALVRPDAARAEAMLRRGCKTAMTDRESHDECRLLGVQLLEGTGDDAKARQKEGVELLTRACRGQRNPDACVSLAEAYEFGTGVPQNDKKARELYETACYEHSEAFRSACDKAGVKFDTREE
ncbi:hypothetical protein KYC5002_28580 [Archangium violaceum]|uniref:tetratricopeptide repeat protein n=1 Tax=Archangium violaceum TaxID=83451 RepID=UPI002B2F4778|nr:hypothetical protein KYC5002_28580 [Archangium gephyra]